jgi:type IV pilus assembly protein PilE
MTIRSRCETGRQVPAPARCLAFSLIEVVVSLALVALLVTLVVPSYRGQQLRAHRAEAVSALLSIAIGQERARAQTGRYAESLSATPPDGLGIEPTTVGGLYALKLEATSPEDGYIAYATAIGPQAQDSACAWFSMDGNGRRDAASTGCWTR